MSAQTSAIEGKRPRALLVGLCARTDNERSVASLLDELEELVSNTGLQVAEKLLVRNFVYSPQYLVGKGKFERIVLRARELGAECVVFDSPLSPAQQRNWESSSGLCAVDRQEIILDIFADRAQTKEARLQVELARLEYSLPRLKRAWTHLDRQRGGGVTQRGGGESQLEIDQRLIRLKIARLKRQLELVKAARGMQRRRRERSQTPTAAIVGYTNAGKSSLLNALAGAETLVADKLFATLDPTTRKLRLPSGGELLLTDTVGFVRALPHSLVDSFKSTLEEALNADFIVHVVDSSNPEATEHMRTTLGVLRELGADSKPVLTVFNKCDLPPLDGAEGAELNIACPSAVRISVKTREGFNELIESLESLSAGRSKCMELLIPHGRQRELSVLYRVAKISARKDVAEGVFVKAFVPKMYIADFEIFAAEGSCGDEK